MLIAEAPVPDRPNVQTGRPVAAIELVKSQLLFAIT
jgi:hypothetical protein